jgi:chromosomal replication initiation ATPase DnaA
MKPKELAEHIYTTYGDQAKIAMQAIIDLAKHDRQVTRIDIGHVDNIDVLQHLLEASTYLDEIITIARQVSLYSRKEQLDFRFKVLEVVRREYDLTKDELICRSRKGNIAEARHVYCYICRTKLPLLSNAEIGMTIHRDNATVLHSTNKVSDRIQYERAFRAKVHDIETHLISI